MIGKSIYDISKDEMREATQDDVDLMFQSLQTVGKIIKVLRKLKPDLVPEPSPDGNFIKELDRRLKVYLQE